MVTWGGMLHTHPPSLVVIVHCPCHYGVIWSEVFYLKKQKQKTKNSHWPKSWLWKEQLCFWAQPSKPLLTSVGLDGLEKKPFVLMKVLRWSTNLGHLLISMKHWTCSPGRAPVKPTAADHWHSASKGFRFKKVKGQSIHLQSNSVNRLLLTQRWLSLPPFWVFADSNHYPPHRPIWILPITCGLAKQSESPDGLLECKPCPFSFFFL